MVRFAEEKDIKRVNELRRQVNDLHVKARPDIFRAGFCRELQEVAYDIIKSDGMDIIVAEKDGAICGFACVEYFDKPESPYNRARRVYHISEFGVDESLKRQKVGTELFGFIKKNAKDRGFDKIELDMWEFNESALHFYEAIGFHTTRRYMEFENVE